jgi:nitrite reductase/ring-hydroxylating ferredoxin subunit
MAFLPLCNTDDIEPGASLRVEPDNLPPLAIFNLDGEYFVINDTCSHGDASLCEGEIEDGEVECPWHNAKFCIKTGKALTFPAVEAQKTYLTRIVDGSVGIEV